MDASLRYVKIIWSAFLFAALLYIWIPEQVHVQSRELAPAFYYAMIGLAILMLPILLVMRKATIGLAEPILRNAPQDASALMKWRSGQIVTAAMCEAIVLFGLVLRFVGATRMQAAPLYALGIGALIVFWPKSLE